MERRGEEGWREGERRDGERGRGGMERGGKGILDKGEGGVTSLRGIIHGCRAGSQPHFSDLLRGLQAPGLHWSQASVIWSILLIVGN